MHYHIRWSAALLGESPWNSLYKFYSHLPLWSEQVMWPVCLTDILPNKQTNKLTNSFILSLHEGENEKLIAQPVKKIHEFYIRGNPNLPSYLLRAISILPSHLHLDLQVISFYEGPVPELFLPLHATCATNCIILDLISKIIFSEEYKSWISLLCSFIVDYIIIIM